MGSRAPTFLPSQLDTVQAIQLNCNTLRILVIKIALKLVYSFNVVVSSTKKARVIECKTVTNSIRSQKLRVMSMKDPSVPS